ncbi:putative protein TRIGALACTOSYLDIACYLGLYCEROL 1, chloroplastic [Iris pallida]|uniref:Uncharacterized protein n=1 Tax=Iris pallida TaxID=29817 RepID=A0AAX6EC53_IRIPA|nr:putative protein TRIGALACTOSYLDIACYLGLYCEROL 1, chloroplastic [Iris pallida]
MAFTSSSCASSPAWGSTAPSVGSSPSPSPASSPPSSPPSSLPGASAPRSPPSSQLCRYLSRPTPSVSSALAPLISSPPASSPAALPFPSSPSSASTVGLASSALLADAVYGVSINIILDSARRALRPWDIISAMIKSQVFGGLLLWSAVHGHNNNWRGKGVGESTTSAVVISLVGIFIADFVLSCIFFQGSGDSLKYAMG